MSSRNFADRLFSSVQEKKSIVVVGLDPHISMLPPELFGGVDLADAPIEMLARGVLEFNEGIIPVIAEYAAAVKPQVAFYEKLGPLGMKVFEATCACARKHGLVVIADVKRGDIGSTATAYAETFLGGPYQSDSVTVNPYLGSDSLKPFIDKCESGYGLFVLVRTSNKSAIDFQDLETANGKVYEIVGDKVAALGEQWIGEMGYSSVGAVVGATWPGELEALRKRLPAVPFLVPGYGAQGGTAKDIVSAFDADGNGAVVNSSRGILFAFKKTGGCWKTAAADATKAMRDEFRGVLGW